MPRLRALCQVFRDPSTLHQLARGGRLLAGREFTPRRALRAVFKAQELLSIAYGRVLAEAAGHGTAVLMTRIRELELRLAEREEENALLLGWSVSPPASAATTPRSSATGSCSSSSATCSPCAKPPTASWCPRARCPDGWRKPEATRTEPPSAPF